MGTLSNFPCDLGCAAPKPVIKFFAALVAAALADSCVGGVDIPTNGFAVPGLGAMGAIRAAAEQLETLTAFSPSSLSAAISGGSCELFFLSSLSSASFFLCFFPTR